MTAGSKSVCPARPCTCGALQIDSPHVTHVADAAVLETKQKIAQPLQNDAAVFRTQETLEKGCKDIDEVVESYKDIGIQDRSMVWNTDLIEAMELENLLINATVTMHSAEARKVGRDDLHVGGVDLHGKGRIGDSCLGIAAGLQCVLPLAGQILLWGSQCLVRWQPSWNQV